MVWVNEKNKLYVSVIVLLAVGSLLGYNYFSGSSYAARAGMNDQPVSLARYLQLKSIAGNLSLASAIGAGVIQPKDYPVRINGSPLALGGKPGIVYVGADYCPFCAAGRWGLIIAMLRFGDFTVLHYMTSTGADVYPYTPTFTFYNSTYNSTYVSFESAETATSTEQPLQSLDQLENVTFNNYDTRGIPFMDFANKSIQAGADFSPGLLDQYNWDQVIAQLNNRNSSVALSVIGSADILTAQICSIDNFQPTSVCGAGYVKAILASMR